jgi:hypothetical protein
VLEEIKSENCPQVVLSSEGFTLNSETDISWIHERLTGFDVEILLYLRNPLELMISRYKQQIKTGKTSDMPQVFFQDRHAYCDYVGLLERWAAIWGTDHVTFRLFDKCKRTPGLVPDFMLATGLCEAEVDIAGHLNVNVSPSDEATATLRMLNRRVKPHGPLGKIRRQVVRETTIGRGLVRLLRAGAHTPLISVADIENLKQELRPLNERFTTEYLEEADRAFFELG